MASLEEFLPATPPPEYEAEIRSWFQRTELAESSFRGMAADLARFYQFCQERGETWLPARAETIWAFLDSLTHELKPATRVRAASSIRAVHRGNPLNNPFEDPLLKTLIADLNRQIKRAKPTRLRAHEIQSICMGLDDSLQATWAKAVLWFAYDSRRQVRHVVSARIEDIRKDPQGTGYLPPPPNPDWLVHWGSTLPASTMKLLDCWLDSAGITEGPLFTKWKRSGPIPGTPTTRHAMNQRLSQVVGHPITLQTIRAGVRCDMEAHGVGLYGLMQASGMQTISSVFSYVKDCEFEDQVSVQLAQLQDR